MAGHRFRFFNEIITTDRITSITEPKDIKVHHKFDLSGDSRKYWEFGETVKCGFEIHFAPIKTTRVEGIDAVPKHLLAAFAALKARKIPSWWRFWARAKALAALRNEARALADHPEMEALKADVLKAVRQHCQTVWNVRQFWLRYENYAPRVFVLPKRRRRFAH